MVGAAAGAGEHHVSFWKTGLLAVATCALAAFVYFVELPGEEVAARERVFPDVSAESIESIALVDGLGRRLRATRGSEGWRVVEPVSAPGDPAVLDRMARSLADLVSVGRIQDPADASVYGLADAPTRVVFVQEGREHGLSIGSQTPLGENVYASVAPTEASGGSAAVQMIPQTAALAFDVDLDALRDRRLLDFAPADVVRLQLAARGSAGGDERSSGFEALLERGENGWQIVSPGPLDADTGAVERLLSDLALLRAEDFVDEPDAAARAAIQEPGFVAVLETRVARETGETAGEPQRFDLGVPTPDAPHLRFARGREGRFYRVRGTLVDHLPKRLFALRARAVTRFDPASASSLQLDYASGESFRAPPEEELVAALAKLDAVEVVAEALGPDEQAALELEPARLRIRVLAEDDELLADLRLGSVDPARGIVARAGESETIWRVDIGLDTLLPSASGKLSPRDGSDAPGAPDEPDSPDSPDEPDDPRRGS